MDLPLKANEAAALADLVYREIDGRPMTPELRAHFAAGVADLGLETFQADPESLTTDHLEPSTHLIRIRTAAQAFTLRIALASSESSPDAVVIGRMRPGGGREIVIELLPDRGNQ
jgi:hypothetical protein